LATERDHIYYTEEIQSILQIIPSSSTVFQTELCLLPSDPGPVLRLAGGSETGEKGDCFTIELAGCCF